MTLNGELLSAGKLQQFIAGTFGGVLQWRAVGGGSGGSAVALGVQSEVEAENIIKAATPKLVNDNRQGLNAATMTGATDALKIDAALTAAQTSGLPVWLDRQLASATSTPTTLTPEVTLFDTRNGGIYSYDGIFYNYPSSLGISRKTDAVQSAAGLIPLQNLFFNARSGGINNAGIKSDYELINGNILAQTIGQVSAINSAVYKPSMGDAQALVGVVFYGGRMITGGDEGQTAFRGGIHATLDYTGTVTAIAGNIITAGGTHSSLGEQRAVINLTTGIHSTGTISGITGTLPVVTGNGTNFTALGSGAVTGLYFAMDADTTAFGRKHVVPIKSIDSATQITLNYTVQGQNLAWPVSTAATSGAYKIYRGSDITKVNEGTFTVASAANFAVGNSIESPLSYGSNFTGVNVDYAKAIPSSQGSYGLTFTNRGTIPVDTAFSVGGGSHNRGFQLNTDINIEVFQLKSATASTGTPSFLYYEPASTGTFSNFKMFRLLNGAGTGYQEFAYDRPNDRFTFENQTSLARVWVTTSSTQSGFTLKSAGDSKQMSMTLDSSGNFVISSIFGLSGWYWDFPSAAGVHFRGTGSATVLHIDDGSSATQTGIEVRHNSTLKRVKVGAIDSGGTGQRLLTVDN
jgi:hypothetical protein